MKPQLMLWLGIFALFATPVELFALPDCDGTAPGASKLCGAANSCKNKTFTDPLHPAGCASSFTKNHTLVYTCDGQGSCSTNCGDHGTGTCTESFECNSGDVTADNSSPPILTLECTQGDALLDGSGDPVISTITKKGYVSCNDTCGG